MHIINSAQIDSSAAAVSFTSTSQRACSPHTKTRVRGLRPLAPLDDSHKAKATVIGSTPFAHSGEKVKLITTEFDDKSYEAPLKDHSAYRAPCLRKSSANKARTLRVQREQTVRRNQIDADVKVDRKHKKGRKTKSRLFYELQIPASCDTPVSALSMDDLEGWFESLHEESCLRIRTATANQEDADPVEISGVPEVLCVPSTIHSIHDSSPLSGISMGNEEWMEELFEDSYLRVGETYSMVRSTHDGDSEVIAKRTPFALGHRLQCPPSKDVSVSPERSAFVSSCDRVCSPKIPLACATAAIEKRSDRDKLNLKKPSLDTVAAFLVSPEWEDHQRILTDWRTFVNIRRPIRASSKECSSSEVTSGQDQHEARNPKDFSMRRSQSMRMFPIFETAMPECDELSSDQPALDPREVERRKKILQRVQPIGSQDRGLKLRKGQ